MTRVTIMLWFCLLPLLVRGQELMFQRITTADGLSNNQVQHIEQLPDGRMLIVAWRGVNVYDGARVMSFPRCDERTMVLSHSHSSYSVKTDRDGLIWIKEWGRLWCLDLDKCEMRGNLETLLYNKIGREVKILDVYIDYEGTLWLLTPDGLLNTTNKQQLSLPCTTDSLGSIEVEDDLLLHFCHDGSVQLMLPGKIAIRKVPCADVPLLGKVLDVRTSRGQDGCYYRKLHTNHYSRIDRFDPKRLEWSPIIESSMVLYGISQIDADHLVVGCRHGLIKLSLRTSPSVLDRTNIAPMPSATIPHLPATFHPTFNIDNGEILQSINVQDMLLDRKGGVWIALGDHGVLYTHPLRHRFMSAQSPQELGISDSVVWMCRTRLSRLFRFTEQKDNDNLTDSNGRRWRATHNGIIVVSKQDSLRITSADGLPSDFVQSMIEDRHGRIWAGTNRGICCIENIEPLKIVNYGPNDGVPQWDAHASSAAWLTDGRIAMQFVQGWVAFYPDSVAHPAYTFTPILTTTTVNGKQYMGTWRLCHTENTIALTFATDNYAFPQSVHYQWRMRGASKWQQDNVDEVRNGQLRLSFMHLPPGNYTVEVQASTEAATFDDNICAFKFTILPPWWRTWWAYTLYSLGALAIIGITAWQYMHRKQEKLKQCMREESLLKQIETLLQQTQYTTEQTPEKETEEKTEEASGEKLSPEEFEFIQRAITLVNQHLTDDYTVVQLAADLCMERTGLYRRLTALVNQSPQIFIRSIRLNRAAEMLNCGYSITDAANAAGFNNISYFGRCFTKEFGCSPSEYLKQHTKEAVFNISDTKIQHQ